MYGILCDHSASSDFQRSEAKGEHSSIVPQYDNVFLFNEGWEPGTMDNRSMSLTLALLKTITGKMMY